ncbi:MAG: aminopeptidase P family protein [Deltaproteobacteria bacterium]|nr:aminopeptidase P family protein [Deltaproteobacteria bacterium]
MAGQELEALLVSRPENRRYLSGYEAEDAGLTESAGHLLISADKALVLTDFRYEEEAAEEAAGFEVKVYKEGLDKLLAGLVKDLGISRLGFEADYLTYSAVRKLVKALDKVKMVPTTELVSGLRVIKEPHEVQAIEVSLALIEEVMDRLIADLKPGQTERQAAWRIVTGLKEKGAEPAFETIVASGPNGAKPHAVPTERTMGQGEAIVIDAGARLKGYCSDITRTVCLGRPSRKFKEVYQTVRQAQLAAIEGLRPGMTSAQADSLAREVILRAGYGQNFGHSLGHGVGLAPHEAPSLSPLREDPLEPGMVHTIEPGIYLPGWGGVRLEVMALVTETGCRVLGALDRFYSFQDGA